MPTYPIHHGITLASGSEIENVVVETLANDPSPLVTGRVWYNSTTGSLKVALGNPAAACELACGADVDSAIAALKTDLEGQLAILDGNTYSKTETDAAITASVDALVSGAPGLLDTLNELAAAIGDDANFVTTIQSQIAAEAATARAAEGVLQGNIDAEATRAGLAEAANASNIIAEALARATADGNLGSLTTSAQGNLVDAVNEVNSDITALQNEVNTTQAGSGLDTTGSYVPHEQGSSSFISTATSLHDCDLKLDAQTATNTTAIAQEVSDRSAAFVTEIAARGAADAVLQGQIDSNDTDIATANTNIATNVADIATNAAAIAVNAANIISHDATMQNELDATQAGAGLAASGAYSANAAMVYIGAATDLADADEKLDAQAKVNADAIAAETTARGNADNAITAVTTANTNANTATQAELDAVEAAAGLGTNGSYSANVSANFIAGATTLVAADDLLDAQVKVNTDGLATETAARILADSGLQTSITANASSAAANAASISAETTRATAAEGVNAGNIATNVTSIATNATAISTETTRAGNAETSLATDITTEATARSNADAALQILVDSNTSAIGAQNLSIRGDYNATVYTYQSGASSLVHAIPHNLNSTFVEISVFMFSGGKWQNDIALIEEVDANNLTITMTDSRDVKVVVRSAADI